MQHSFVLEMKDNDIFTTSKIIADGTNNKHHSMTAIMQKYESDFAEFGKVRFEMEPLERGQKEKVYRTLSILNEESTV